jgi:hypothetical protein
VPPATATTIVAFSFNAFLGLSPVYVALVDFGACTREPCAQLLAELFAELASACVRERCVIACRWVLQCRRRTTLRR